MRKWVLAAAVLACSSVNMAASAAEKLKVQPRRTVFVGDMPSDMEAARAADAIAVGILHSNHVSDEEQLWRAGAHAIVYSFHELRVLLGIPYAKMV